MSRALAACEPRAFLIALPNLNEAEDNIEEGRVVSRVAYLARVAWHGNEHVVLPFDLNLQTFDLNMEAAEEGMDLGYFYVIYFFSMHHMDLYQCIKCCLQYLMMIALFNLV